MFKLCVVNYEDCEKHMEVFDSEFSAKHTMEILGVKKYTYELVDKMYFLATGVDQIAWIDMYEQYVHTMKEVEDFLRINTNHRVEELLLLEPPTDLDSGIRTTDLTDLLV